MSDHTGYTPEQLAYGMSGHPTTNEMLEWLADYGDNGYIVNRWPDLGESSALKNLARELEKALNV